MANGEELEMIKCQARVTSSLVMSEAWDWIKHDFNADQSGCDMK